MDQVVHDVLPQFKQVRRPFLLIYRLHESANPRAANHALAEMEESLKALGLYDTTNIVVCGEHGASSVWKASKTSIALKIADDEASEGAATPVKTTSDGEKASDSEERLGELPAGFLAIDLAAALQRSNPRLSLFDPDQDNEVLDWFVGEHPSRGNAIIGVKATDPHLTIEARGGHDLIYFPRHLSKREATDLAWFVIDVLLDQDYVSGFFVNEKRVGRLPSAVSLEHIGWSESAGQPIPDIVVNFASVTTGCSRLLACTAMIADTPLDEGKDSHGAFSRADTWTFMAVRGPDFQHSLIDRLPASNADIARTIRALLPVPVVAKGQFAGRVLTESLAGYENWRIPEVRKNVISSKPSSDGVVTQVLLQSVGPARYFDAAGFPGWTVGIKYQAAKLGWRFWQWDWPHPRKLRIEITPD